MVQLIKQRLKTKQTVNLFLSCLKELCAAHPDNLATILKHTIFNELSNARNPNNMAMLGVMFQVGYQKIFLSFPSKYFCCRSTPRKLPEPWRGCSSNCCFRKIVTFGH